MGSGTSYTLAPCVGTITMDDGKVSALSPHTLGELNAAPDRRAHVASKLRSRRALVESVTAAARLSSASPVPRDPPDLPCPE